jgi:uncharacterized protein (UPF0261 family)
MAAMARAWAERHAAHAQTVGKALIGLSSFGNLQPAVDRITGELETNGYEVIHFHASGPGGRALEALARAGELAGVIDLTTSELTDLLTGGVYSAGDGRLREAGAAGLPQVVVPGCLDFTNWWVGGVPEKYRSRAFCRYNTEILLMRTNAEEFARLGKLMAERLNAATGGVKVMIPSRGFSQLTDRRMHDLEGREIGPWCQPETDQMFVASLRRHLRRGTIEELPNHINDAAFADACARELMAMLGGSHGSANRRP